MKNQARYFGPWTPGSKFQKSVHAKQNTRPPTFKDNDQSHPGFYSKSCNRRHRPDNISINQLVVLTPQSPIVCVTPKKNRNKARWKNYKRKQKKLEKLANSQKEPPKQTPGVVPGNQEPSNCDKVITLSDSENEEDSCVLIPENWPVLSVCDSDDDNKKDISENKSSNDDVVFVEPVETPVEVINLDEETESPKNSQQKNNETASVASDNSSVSDSPTKKAHRERKELLSTPDSASNDFVNSSGVELNHKNFNFSLHGSDFKSGDFVKPANPNETCETESSSSTTDLNSANLMKTIVFNEIEFPKDDVFSESNLESFGNFITPMKSRANTPVAATSSTPKVEEQIKQSTNSSDSSSESDFEDSRVEKVKKIMNLPELSPMQTKEKSKKISSKYDLVDAEADESLIKQKQKKKQKNKKKKSEKEETVDCTEAVQKKRKSSQMEDAGDSVLKKKSKNKKKSRTASPELEANTKSEQKCEGVDVLLPSLKKVTETDETIKKEHTVKEEPEVKEEPLKIKSPKVVESEESAMDGFLVVDETFATTTDIKTISSDSDSILSSLAEDQDIQLINCEAKFEPDCTASTSKSGVLNLANCSVQDLQFVMSNDPNLWTILDRDRFPIKSPVGKRCNKCKELGHIALKCPNKLEPKCKLCGEGGHFEPRCPNKMCTQCGKRSYYTTAYCSLCFKLRDYQCQICSMTGHAPETCPDLWRRYHLTTTEGPLKTYSGPALKPNLWCSGCAQPGHLEHMCDFYKSMYPPTDPFIKNYDQVYDDENENEPQEEAPQPDPQPNFAPNPPQNYVMQGVNQGLNYNCNYDQFANAFIQNGMFVANQQNFYTNQFAPQDGYMQGYPQYSNAYTSFCDNLPKYISLATPQHTVIATPQHTVIATPQHTVNLEAPRPEIPSLEFATPAERKVHCNSMFFSSSGRLLRQFVSRELAKLSKISFNVKRYVTELKRRQVPRGARRRAEYYELANMVLFGVLCLGDGKFHLNALKQLKMDKSKLSCFRRQKLHRAYCFIFGCERHDSVDYNELISRI
ncbi:uncharacterized protein Zcchc7 [Tribolium castaneum]|nr:PREDICTED: uncharacterized protein LOC103312586 isoform X2 [Tribolium castaneum]XP_008191810.1 PREDICTED: uncharacterized protein LOC103312586 isoform X2 [Tribolium castaneum]|eukprot:XP_008191804.1 PREDICTED: uncharacterized protein LOC103312586 isoform X2 [Tribolium castaneum]